MRISTVLSAAVFAFISGCGSDESGGASTAEIVSSNLVAPTVLASNQGGPLFVAVDQGEVFWSNNTSGDIMMVSNGGSDTPRVLFHGQAPRRIRAKNGQVFFVDTSAGTVAKIDVATGSVTTLATGQTAPMGLSVHGDDVYWTNSGTQSVGYHDGAVMALSAGLVGAQAIASSQSQAMGLDVNDSFVYWTSVVDKSVRRMKLGTTNMEVVATRQSGPATVALDAEHAFWTNAYTGDLMMASVETGAVTRFATRGATSCATDGTNVYWTTETNAQSAVWKAPASGGQPTMIASDQTDPGGIAVDDQFVYWADMGAGTILRAPK